MPRRLAIIIFCTLISYQLNTSYANQQSNALAFDDSPLADELELPNWFKLSFLDLQESLDEATESGKRGLIIYFGRKDCAYCKAQLEINWGSKDIIEYTQKYYDVIAIDVRGQRTVTDFDGKTYTEKSFASRMRTDFTPSILFYEKKGRLALRLPGFRPPYQFRAALEYVSDAHYKKESYSQYLARAENALSFGQEELNEHDAFAAQPFNLDRSKKPAKSPLIVFFEHKKCHACDVFHGGPLDEPEIGVNLYNMDAIQLDTDLNTPVITPSGKKTTAKKWAKELELSFAPTLIFFDEQGKEILRVDSIIRLYRLNNVLSYILSKGYKKYPTFQIWREQLNR
jgi:thioredoxin-related protein